MHTMELPRKITIGKDCIGMIGDFLATLSDSRVVSIISGKHVMKIVQEDIEDSLKKTNVSIHWHDTVENKTELIDIVQGEIKSVNPDMILGVGGGSSVDVAKMVSFNLKKPFISIPTAASHDGIASPFVSIKSDKPHSIVTSAPMGVFVDMSIIEKAPDRLLSSGCGDLIANIIAIHDWKLGHESTGEYYGRYAAELASLSAKMVVESKDKLEPRVVVEALISAGVAACIAGSSRPCSGAEHLFSHALDVLAPRKGLHGEKCGIGSILMAKLQGQDWQKIRDALVRVGSPTSAREINLEKDDIIQALLLAPTLRPERYTILNEVKLDEASAASLAESTKVL